MPSTAEREASEVLSSSYSPRDVLHDVYALRRRVYLAVYAVITFDLPLYFAFNYTLQQVAILAVVGWLVAGLSIHFAFAQIVRLRKRTSYPAMLMVRAADAADSGEAAVRALEIVNGLLDLRAACLSVIGATGAHEILANRAVTPDAAVELLKKHRSVLEMALDNNYPMIVPGGDEDVTIAFVPIVALKRSIGMLYLAGHRRNSDLEDRQLLSAVGEAIGMALDNLRQREELSQKEARLRSVMNGARVVLFAVDSGGITRFMQGRGLERLGVSQDMIIGRPFEDLYANYPQVVQSFRRAFAGEEVTSVVTITANEMRVVFEYRLAPERDDRGRIVGVIGVATDVTERRQAEEALHESRRALETLIGNLPGFAYRCRNDDDWSMEYVSDGIEELTGYRSDEFIEYGHRYADIIHPDDLEPVRKAIRAAIQAQDHYRLEYRICTLEGAEKWMWEQGQPIYAEDGTFVALEGFINDITERKKAEQAVVENEERFRDIFENARDAMFTFSFKGTFVSANNRCLEVFGYTLPEFLEVNVGSVVAPEYQQIAAESIRRAYQGDPTPYEIEVVTKSGCRVPLEITARVICDENGAPKFVQGIARDISERKRAEKALAEGEARYRELFENANDMIFTYDMDGHFQSINRKSEEVSGYTREELLGRTVWDVVAPEFHETAAEYTQRTRAGGDPGPFEVEIMAKDGSRIPIEVSERVLCDESGEPVLIQGIGRDISDRRLAEETIRRLAYHDALTGLPNRSLFEDRLNVTLAQARRHSHMVSVMFLDLDRFKYVNDTLGHGAGDRLLQSVARDLSEILRDGDTIARVGGDEFTILLPEIEGAETAMDIARRILECLRQPRMIGPQEFRTTGSIGVTMFPGDGYDGETLLRNADTAMYRAKEAGRDNYQLYTRSMNERMLERLAFENDLRHALKREELTLYYQPIIDVKTSTVVGAEALVRWQHPVRGIIAPDSFIPFAEESGLIVEIGEWVLRTACCQIRQWQEDGLNLGRVGVNLSARQLQQENIVERFAEVLRQTGVLPQMIALEITEGAVLANAEHIITALNQLNDMGFSISLDDFGTGYSSLTYLKAFPVETVKIDRSFVCDIERDASDATIVSTVIAMANSLNLKVIAEGVETEQQLQFLRDRGCDEFQGYLISPPVPPDEFLALVTGRRERETPTPARHTA